MDCQSHSSITLNRFSVARSSDRLLILINTPVRLASIFLSAGRLLWKLIVKLLLFKLPQLQELNKSIM